MSSKLIDKKITPVSPWVSLVERVVQRDKNPPESFHSLALADYINVVCETEDGQVPLVRQFRPALNAITLELPGGLLDRKVLPEEIATSELREEVGLTSDFAPELLGIMAPDTGRLENRAHVYYIKGAKPIPGWQPENGVDHILVSKNELLNLVQQGTFHHAIHVAALFLADRKVQFFKNL